jgi:capsular polysaccharide transport system permease protein
MAGAVVVKNPSASSLPSETRPGTQAVAPAVGDPRALAIARSLRKVARKARGVGIARPTLGLVRLRGGTTFTRAILIAFVASVLVPVLVSGLYLLFITSDQYASEARFAVRGGENPVLDSMTAVSAMSPLQNVQDSLIVVDYIHGRSIVEELDRSIDLRKRFSRAEADYLSRFDPTEPIEELVEYWRKRVAVSIDPMSGIISVVVRAFTPQDALDIANGIVVLSEKLANELSERSRRDSLRQARLELDRAEASLQEKIKAMRDLRNREGLLDAEKTGEAMIQMIGELRLQLARLEQEYASQLRAVSATSPQMKVMNARILDMREQIKRLENQMTERRTSAGTVLSESMSRFEQQKIEHEIALKHYAAAAAGFERARLELENQRVYVVTFLKPVLAEDALYPYRGWIWAAIWAICLAIWGSGVGATVFIRNYAAV